MHHVFPLNHALHVDPWNDPGIAIVVILTVSQSTLYTLAHPTHDPPGMMRVHIKNIYPQFLFKESYHVIDIVLRLKHCDAIFDYCNIVWFRII